MALSMATATTASEKVALVVGATGLVGRELVRILTQSPDWTLVYGIARCPETETEPDNLKYRFLRCDLLDPRNTIETLRPLAGQVTHMFWVTWSSEFPLDSQECSDQNRSMLAYTLDAITTTTTTTLRHVSLQTGTKHYVSLESPLASAAGVEHDEESPRVDSGPPNFYYALEDLLLRSERMMMVGGWSVHRPGMLLGASQRSHFNIVASLCVYGSVCRHLGLPFVFGGNRRCWEEPYMDASDARLVAGQQVWWASGGGGEEKTGKEAALNVGRFAWKDVWPALSWRLTVTGGGGLEEGMTYGRAMGDKGAVWEEIVAKEGLMRTRIGELANWSFLDAVFRFPGMLIVRRPTKAQRLGYTATYSAADSLCYWVDRSSLKTSTILLLFNVNRF